MKGLFWLASLALTLVESSPTTLETRALTPDVDAKCKGYSVSGVKEHSSGLTATLKLIGKGCTIYGNDLPTLKLEVTYDTKERLHVKIADPSEKRYQVPEFTVPRPKSKGVSAKSSDLVFKYKQNPFTFTVSRKSTGEVLFDTTGNALVFEDFYLRVATNLGADPNIYGLGEHTETFRLPNNNLVRTLWNRDSYGVPTGSNLYSSHPAYFEHRKAGTHGVFLLNSNGMDVKMAPSGSGKTKLEYNIIGGIFDFYFLSGPTPKRVAEEYAEIVGLSAIPAYWGLGSHQCRYGYRDWIDVAEVIGNYSAAGIPLETMWTDIDYMYNRWIFTLDPERFPLDKMQRIVNNLHKNNQHYIMMIDPAIAYQDYPSFQHAIEMDALLKEANGDIYKGVVWPGVTAFPDWFAPKTQDWWTGEFKRFFDPKTGVNIDGSWIDMNEPANFCSYPCTNLEGDAEEQNMPPPRLPVREPSRPVPGFPETNGLGKRQAPATDPRYITPPYAIKNDVPNGLSDKTVHTDIVHADGHIEFDVHNLYGSSMSTATYKAMLARRPTNRPFIITRSTFVGAGKEVGKWLGDNMSTWYHYRNSISGVLQFASIFQVPLVGADVCGFGGNTTETLCARWTALGAFAPFYRNHNGDTSISQEPYRWPIVASAARKAITIRYSLLDYIYTAMWRQSKTGTPSVSALWFEYPKDEKTFDMDLQYFYGPSVLVSPVTEESSTSVDIYLPDDRWYDFHTGQTVAPGQHTLTDIDFDEIPLHIKGGSIIPLRQAKGAMTVAEVRKRGFELLIAPGKDGKAEGELYLDDGISLQQAGTTHVKFSYKDGKVKASGRFGYTQGGKITSIRVLGGYGAKTKNVDFALSRGFEVRV